MTVAGANTQRVAASEGPPGDTEVAVLQQAAAHAQPQIEVNKAREELVGKVDLKKEGAGLGLGIVGGSDTTLVRRFTVVK